VAAVKLGARQSGGGGHGMNAVGTGRRRCLDRAADEWASAVSDFFQFIQNWLDFKNQMDALTCSKNSQCLHVASWGYREQFSQLCRHPIPNIKRVKNPGTDSIFESLMNFKRDLNLLEKSEKFSKIPPRLYLHKSEFRWDHLYARN
jgi:hypothetical protein